MQGKVHYNNIQPPKEKYFSKLLYKLLPEDFCFVVKGTKSKVTLINDGTTRL